MGGNFTFRQGLDTDAANIAALHATNWKLDYKEDMSPGYLQNEVDAERLAYWTDCMQSRDPNRHVIVVERDGGEFVGFACFYIHYDKWGHYIDNLHVYHRYRGSGLGRAMMDRSFEKLKTDFPGSQIWLWVLTTNIVARGFYQRFGGVEQDVSVWHMPGGGEAEIVRVVWEVLA